MLFRWKGVSGYREDAETVEEIAVPTRMTERPSKSEKNERKTIWIPKTFRREKLI